MQVTRNEGACGYRVAQENLSDGARKVAVEGMSRNTESGFSLIELLIVVIIIGVLASIAIPTYLSQREQAQAAAVQSDLRNAATSAVACAADNGGSYANCTLAALDTNYDFNPSDNVALPAADVVATATRWAANANYSPNPTKTKYFFDTANGSQIKEGKL